MLKRVSKGEYNMKKTIELNYEIFNVRKPRGKLKPFVHRSLTDCYKKPSVLKQSIYSNWVHWLIALNDSTTDMRFGPMSVLTYNTNVFTLGCDVYNNSNQLIGQIYISPKRQEFWKVA